MFAVNNNNESVNRFNVGSEDTINPTEVGEIVVEEIGFEDVVFTYTGGNRRWKGDVPKMHLDVEKMKKRR